MENKQDKGFTLVELLIVIVILGILATVTVFAVRGITDQGQTAACSADQKTIQTAVEAFYAQNGTLAGATEVGLVPKFMVSQSKNYDISTFVAGSAAGVTPVVASSGGEVIIAPTTGNKCTLTT